ncbi:helix-turn-helix domain-containing protein [Mycobacterium scrofulaceum]|nr:helix-turn-helix transcriptional regulator [Mycobacterium scrofulaceum]
MTDTMAEVAGRNVRALRQAAGWTLNDFAHEMGRCGLQWSTGRVGDFEAGRAAASFESLYAVTAALSGVLKKPVALADLFAGDGWVQINDRASVELSALRAALSGKAITSGPRVTEKVSGQVLPKWARSRGVTAKLFAQVINDFRESDDRMCRSIGVESHIGAAAMAVLWGRTFSAERDDQTEPGSKPQRRGQVSRQLKAELLKVIPDGNN